ncbi:unnamed protein product [Arabidopsis thaliana]|uniref:(thale cress) hypothetical protein n=1 Tax=Arabidopsis thaliana TaxID=3702 RepID=A0A7G2E6D5_ARATH|nr:unnamed protein product [Arabidopsis thaliana]
MPLIIGGKIKLRYVITYVYVNFLFYILILIGFLFLVYWAYPEAAKLRSHPLRFIPLLDVVFRDETVVVEESWQPRRGVHRRAPVLDLSDNECPNNNGDEREDLMQNRERDHMRPPTPDWMSQTPMENSPTSANSDPPFASQERSSTHTQVKNVSRNRKRKQNPADSTLDRIAATMEKI